MPSYVGTRARVLAVVAIAATLAGFILRTAHANDVATFAATAVALAGLAALVGEGTDQLGHRLGSGATGVLQSALGNLPELFIGFFALQAGLVEVVRSALIGSILANSLFVLGLAFFLGGLRNGVQHFGTAQTRMMSMLLILAVASIAIPTVATAPGAPDFGHAKELSVFVAIVLLVVFAASVPYSLSPASPVGPSDDAVERGEEWPVELAVAVLTIAAVGAAVVSDWFVVALEPAMGALGMSQAFAGLVVVAIAGNAVENVVGVQMMVRNRTDLAISLIQNSSLQVALALGPVLMLLSLFVGSATLTFVVPPLLIAALGLTALLGALVVVDGDSTWLEGLALMVLYAIIAAGVWWGPTIAH